jgi:hypothetical protein
MPGYLLFEERFLQPHSPRGFPANPVRMGFLDFLRELRQEVFPFDRTQKLLLVGLEEVLLAAGIGENLLAVSLEARKILASRANELNSNMGWIQVVFRRPLKRAEDFWFDPGGGRRVSLRPIFGSPVRKSDASGNEYYQVGFNLT